MTITTLIIINIAFILGISLAFILGRKSVTKNMKKTRKIKKGKKTIKAKKERKPRKTWKAKAEDLAGFEEEYKKLTQNNELVPVTKTVKA